MSLDVVPTLQICKVPVISVRLALIYAGFSRISQAGFSTPHQWVNLWSRVSAPMREGVFCER